MLLRDQIQEISATFTTAERKLSAALLSDYPFAGLATIQNLGERTTVSASSITRFVHKLGFKGYQEFQHRLIGELREEQRSPVELHMMSTTVKEGFLSDFLTRTKAVINSMDSITETQFEHICALLADRKRSIFFIGGRISDPLAQYFSRLLLQIRKNVFHLPSDTDVWPEYILRMQSKDILFIVDFRRYQKKLAALANLAVNTRNTKVVLLTDKWLSPASKSATDILPVAIENGTAWDSYLGAVTLVEAMVTRIAEQDWEATKKRIKSWDAVRLEYGDFNND